VHKIENEIDRHDRVLSPTVKITKQLDSRPGSRTLDELDTFIIIFLYMDEPSRGIPTYAAWLHNFSGTLVSKSVLRRFFKEAFLLELDFAIQT
jgi:hypothetical protein